MRGTERKARSAARDARAWIGTSGWVYEHWRGRFYPSDLREAEWLPYYAARFRTVEVNFTFYRLPERSVFESWREKTAEGFVFAVKASRFLTHIKRLRDPEQPLARLMERAGGLGDKLGPILFQLPPNLLADRERLEGFLGALAAYPEQRFAIEFRHPSWVAEWVFDLLRGAQIALCIPYAQGLERQQRRTASFTYLRMHHGEQGVGFSDREIADCAARCRGFMAEHADVYVYFNNDAEGHAVRDALRLQRNSALGFER